MLSGTALCKLSMLQVVLFRLIRSSRGFDSSRALLSSHSRRLTPFAAASRNPPPEFSFLDDDDEDTGEGKFYESFVKPDVPSRYEDAGPDFSIAFNDDGDVAVQPRASAPRKRSDTATRSSTRDYSTSRSRDGARPRDNNPRSSSGSSWMDRNNVYTGEATSQSRTFREDFRGTRVFVQNLPPQCSWQDLKDHFRVAGEVVFASVSTNSNGAGIVQFETTDMAQHAIQVMSQYPLNGYTLSVRKDVQEGKAGASLSPRVKGPTPPTKWKCADDSNPLDAQTETAVRMLIKERDFARRRKDYDLSDEIREQLKSRYGVHIDDRLKMWWNSVDGKTVPVSVQEMKPEGRWQLEKWRMIPTTPENDACVNPDLINGLLAQRDIARREKDFATADALLDQARNSPDGDLSLRIHDESRTWRIWTEERPAFLDRPDTDRPPKMSPVEECLAITAEHAPERVEEIKRVLEQFPGREYNILKKLKRQFNV